jgi:hypothetical protein
MNSKVLFEFRTFALALSIGLSPVATLAQGVERPALGPCTWMALSADAGSVTCQIVQFQRARGTITVKEPVPDKPDFQLTVTWSGNLNAMTNALYDRGTETATLPTPHDRNVAYLIQACNGPSPNDCSEAVTVNVACTNAPNAPSSCLKVTTTATPKPTRTASPTVPSIADSAAWTDGTATCRYTTFDTDLLGTNAKNSHGDVIYVTPGTQIHVSRDVFPGAEGHPFRAAVAPGAAASAKPDFVASACVKT